VSTEDLGPVGRQVLAGFEEDFTRVEVDDVGEEDGLVHGREVDLGRGLVRLGELVGHLLVELHAGEDGADRAAAADGVTLLRFLLIEDALVEHERHLIAGDPRLDGRVELAKDLLVRGQTEGAQEDGAEELALAVDADVEDVLLVVLELHPGAAVRDDLGQEGVGRFLGEEDARRAVELRDDDALGAVDDERAVLGHQRDVAEEDFLFLGVAHVLDAGVGVLVVDEEAEGDFQRNAVGHPALLALFHRVLHLQVDGVAADVADLDAILVDHAALLAAHRLFMRVIGDDLRAAVRAGHAQVLETLELAALALPVPDGELDEVERARLPEITEGEDAGEDGLQSRVFALLRQEVHLQEPFVRLSLDVNQIRQRHIAANLREVVTDRLLFRHGSVHSDDSFPRTSRDAGTRRISIALRGA
jgi:hypothetical protein